MSEIGIVYEIQENKAIVLTPESEFVAIKSRNDMFLGQQVIFDNKDIYNLRKNYFKHASVISSVAAVFVLLFLLFRPSHYEDKVYGFIDIDINPSVQFVIDDDYKLIEAMPLNDDARLVMKGLEIKDKHVKNVILQLVDNSIALGFIDKKDKNIVLISAVLNDKNKEVKSNKSEEDKRLDTLLNDISNEVNEFDESHGVSSRTLKATLEERKEALERNLSMGKYRLYLEAKEQQVDISFEEVYNMEVSDLLDSLKDNEYEEPMPTPVSTPTLYSTPSITSVQTPVSAATAAAPQIQTPAAPKPTLPLIPTPTPMPTQTPIPVRTTEIKMTRLPDPTPTVEFLYTPTPERSKTPPVNSGLKIQYYSIDKRIDTQGINYSFRMLNTGNDTIDLKDVKVRYYFKEEVNKPLNFAIYFYSSGEKSDVHGKFHNISGNSGANKYLEIAFDSGSVKPGEMVYVGGAFYRDDWSRFDQSNDYSFNPTDDTYVDWKRMTAYISGDLVWGIEPD
ncbi:MAG: anti-sigma-I factor RsgI family protein [Bacillota bacterium]